MTENESNEQQPAKEQSQPQVEFSRPQPSAMKKSLEGQPNIEQRVENKE